MSYYVAPNQRNDLAPTLQAIRYPVYLQRLSATDFSDPIYLLVTSSGLRYSHTANERDSNAVRNTFINETFQTLQTGTLGMCSVTTSNGSQSTSTILSSTSAKPVRISLVLLDRQDIAAAHQLPYETRITTLTSFRYTKDPSIHYNFLKAMPTQKVNDMKRMKTLLQKEQSTGFILTELTSTFTNFVRDDNDDNDDDDGYKTSDSARESESDDDAVELSSNDKTRFDGTQYLGTDEVDAYINMMRLQFADDVSVFPAAYWIALTENNQRMLDDSDERLVYYNTRPWFRKIGRANIVYVPIVISKHWILATINFSEHSIKTYDSLVSYRYNKRLVSQNLIQLANYLKAPFSDAEWTFASEPGCLQSDGYNCGIFVLHKIRLGTLADVPTQFDADDMREHMGMEHRLQELQPFQ